MVVIVGFRLFLDSLSIKFRTVVLRKDKAARCSAADECTCHNGLVVQVKPSDGAARFAAESDESDDEPIVKKLKVG